MTPVVALIWFICMATAVFVVLAGGVFLAARSGNPPNEQRTRVHVWSHAWSGHRSGGVRAHAWLPHHKHAA